ncbi:MAG: hypothetical protein ABSB69_06850 [Solirubrobacteraceae bacterium]
MRSIKLTVAIVAAATSLTLVSAAAGRNRHENGARRNASGCHTTLNVAPRLLTSGESVLAFGRLRCAGAGTEANQTVTLYESPLISPGYSVAGTTTTDAHGFYQITVSGLTADSVFYATAGPAQSGHRTVRVAAQVTVSGPPEGVVPTALRTGRHNRVTFSGTVNPTDSGAVVVLQRQNAISGNEWHPIGFGHVNTEGDFSITHTFVVAGDANLRVLVRSGRRNVASPSNVLSYEISQAQNPQLTIESSANPISYGQTVTINGAVAGAPNTAVQLLARSAARPGYTQVGEVKTNGAGNYTFPAQTPLVSTFYRVQGAGKKSAVLYEGVKYVLTAGVSATTVQSGQSLTFSGTVTPGETGHVVYLERENAAGTGFHVIEVGTVTASSTYTIVHTFYDVGTSVVRIKIPGGPLNGTTDSTPFTIAVTPAPAAALTPEAPSNSTQPPEGKV